MSGCVTEPMPSANQNTLWGKVSVCFSPQLIVGHLNKQVNSSKHRADQRQSIRRAETIRHGREEGGWGTWCWGDQDCFEILEIRTNSTANRETQKPLWGFLSALTRKWFSIEPLASEGGFFYGLMCTTKCNRLVCGYKAISAKAQLTLLLYR